MFSLGHGVVGGDIPFVLHRFGVQTLVFLCLPGLLGFQGASAALDTCRRGRKRSDSRDAGQTGMDGGTHRPPGHSDPACRRKGRTVWPLDFVRIRSLSVRAPELVEAFRGIPSSNIGDCTQRMNCCLTASDPFNDLPWWALPLPCGCLRGITWWHRRRWTMPGPGDIIVIDAAGNTDRGMVGGMMLAYAGMRGLAALW